MQKLLSPHVILIGVMLVWGISWPSSKIGLAYISPMWFTGFRLAGASIIMFAILFFLKRLSLPKKQDIPMILNIGLIQMALIILLVNTALQHLDAGRSALLVDSSVIWVSPIAILFFREKITPIKFVGIMLGVAGILILIGPWMENWADKDTIIGYGILSLATLIWASVIVYMRYGKWHSSPAELLPWQFLIGALPVLALAIIFEPTTQIHFTSSSVTQLLYNTIFATAFGYWGIATATKQLPTITTGLLLLGIPFVAVISSNLILHEKLTMQIIFAMILLLGGVYCAREKLA